CSRACDFECHALTLASARLRFYLSPHPLFFLSSIPPSPRSPLFPYTTLFRSRPSPPRSSRRPPRLGPHPCTPAGPSLRIARGSRSEEHTSELQSRVDLVCRLLLEKKKGSPRQSARRDTEGCHHLPYHAQTPTQ